MSHACSSSNTANPIFDRHAADISCFAVTAMADSASADERVAFIGAGNIATAVIRGLVSKGIVPAAAIRASSPSGPSSALRELGIAATRSNAEAVADATMIVFAVKPMMMEAALFSCREVIPADALVVSVAAGITSDQIQSWLGAGRQRAIVRAMPNTPTAVGQGACGICPGSNGLAGAEHLARVERLFSAAGVVHTVKESQMDAVTGLSGSGPAFVCLVIEALADGGVAAGLPRPVALSLATQLVRRSFTQQREAAMSWRGAVHTYLHPRILLCAGKRHCIVGAGDRPAPRRAQGQRDQPRGDHDCGGACAGDCWPPRGPHVCGRGCH